MANSNYCNIIITLNNGKKISWMERGIPTPLFQLPELAIKKLKEISSLQKLESFLLDCISVSVDNDRKIATLLYKSRCKDFDKELKKVYSFSTINNFYLGYSKYKQTEWETTITKESVEINFETRKLKTENHITTKYN